LFTCVAQFIGFSEETKAIKIRLSNLLKIIMTS